MALVFKTDKEHPHDVEIVGAGVAHAFGKGGVPVEHASQTMPELSEQNPDGTLVLDEDGNSVPLTGSTLTSAAKAFAEERGLVTENASAEAIAAFPQDVGSPADRPPLEEVAKEEYERTYGYLDEDAVYSVVKSASAEPEPEPEAPAPAPAEGSDQ